MLKYGDYHTGPQEARPLTWDALAPDERQLLGNIHARLKEISAALNGPREGRSEQPWAEMEHDPRGRAMVINGNRGSGKTTLLVTFLDQLHRDRLGQLKDPLDDAATGVRPLPILDFDPLPPGLPLHAWLVQAWLPVVQYIEKTTARSHGSESAVVHCAPLREAWDELFSQAVNAWSDVHDGRPMVDRLFDHRDQLHDYQALAAKWRSFVDDVFVKLHSSDPGASIILVPIDDVDLQVKRNVELIHAIRLLRHPRVVYLITADLTHTEEVIFLDLLHQHHRLAGSPIDLSSIESQKLKKSCRSISHALMEKAFPRLFVFDTAPVPISRMLNWPDDRLKIVLDHLKIDGQGVGTWLVARASGSTGSDEAFMHWRGVQRVLDEVRHAKSGESQATLVLRHLLEQGDAADYVHDISRRGNGAVIDFALAGNLRVAAVPAWFTGGPNRRIIVGTELENTLVAANDQVLDVPSALLARELHEAMEDPKTGGSKNRTGQRGPVQADRIILSIGTVLVWTRWTNAPRDAVFLWPFAQFPRIPILRAWLKAWDDLTNAIRDTRDPDDKLAFAWLHCQLIWCGLKAPTQPTWDASIELPMWNELLGALSAGASESKEFREWLDHVLPLFTLPEFGLPEAVQQLLLDFVFERAGRGKTPEQLWDWLKGFDSKPAHDGGIRRGERHQCAMNALYQVWEDESRKGSEPTDEEGDQLILQADRLFPDAPWYQLLQKLQPKVGDRG